nr:hypothetical protein [Sedimenticola hydrogenitrophicus]
MAALGEFESRAVGARHRAAEDQSLAALDRAGTNAVGIALDPNVGIQVAAAGDLGFLPLVERQDQDLAFVAKYGELLAEKGALTTDASIELVRGLDGEISWDFAKLFGSEGVGELLGISVGPRFDVPLRSKLEAASDLSLSSDVPRIFAGISTDASFEDQVIAAFNMIGGRATDEQMLGVINQIRANRNTSSSAFVLDITAARLTSEAGALEARGFGYDTIQKLSFDGDFFAGPTGPTIGGKLLTSFMAGISENVSFATDKLAPADLRSEARNSLIVDAALTLGPVAAGRLFKLGGALSAGRAAGVQNTTLSRGAELRAKYGHLSPQERTAKIDELSRLNYERRLSESIGSQDYVFRYLSEDGLDKSLRYGSVRGYTTTEFSHSSSSVARGAQIKPEWGEPAYGVAIPVDKVRGFSVARPFGNQGSRGWEVYTNSYPEAGSGGWSQFLLDPVPIEDVHIFRLKP